MSVLSSGPGPALPTHTAVGQTCSRKRIRTVAARPGPAIPLVVMLVYICANRAQAQVDLQNSS